MNAVQTVFPFRARKARVQPASNVDLIGLSYKEGNSTVTVTGICRNDDQRLILRRYPTGATWTMRGWLVRLILTEESKKDRKRAA